MVVCHAALENGGGREGGGVACKRRGYVDINNEVMIYTHDEDIM